MSAAKNLLRYRIEPLGLEVFDAALVGELREGGVEGHTGQELQMVGVGGGLGLALAEEGDLFAAVGAEEVAHVFDDAYDGDGHHFGHLDGLFDDHADKLLGGGDDDDAVKRERLEDAQGDVAGAGGHIDEEIVYVPDDVGPELGHDAADDRAAPDDGVGFVIQ